MEITRVPVKSIVLDECNPRIAHAMEGVTAADKQDWITLALGQSSSADESSGPATSYSSLKASIRAYKGLINPIILKERKAGSFVVVEGNTRVAIYRELKDEGAPGNWDAIPAIVQKTIEEVDEHAIRLQAHLVGPRPWGPYAKAKYLHDLYHHGQMSISQLLEFCGGSARRREIESYIEAYRDMQAHYMPLVREAGGPPDYRSFSSFVELQNIKPALVKAGYNETDFAKWVIASKLSPQNTVRALPKILAHPEAKRQFLAHGAREAQKVLDQPNANSVIENATLEQLALALTVKIRQLSWQDVQSLIQMPDSAMAQSIISCFDELQSLTQTMEPSGNG